jgi:hypothetical protein
MRRGTGVTHEPSEDGDAVVIDDEFGLGVNRVGPVGERELEHLGLSNGLGRTCFDAQVAVNAAEIVDLVDVPVTLTRANGVVHGVIESTDVDAVGGTDTGTEFTADALLKTIGVTVELVTAMEAWLWWKLVALFWVLLGGDLLEHRQECDTESPHNLRQLRHY